MITLMRTMKNKNRNVAAIKRKDKFGRNKEVAFCTKGAK